MLGSHGLKDKQHPYDESVCTPLLLRWPAAFGSQARVDPAPFSAPDFMPTLLGLCGVPIPDTVEGFDHSPRLRGERALAAGPAYLACFRPHHQVHYRDFGRDWRGLRTERYTFIRDPDGPWLLFDNQEDPFQMRNLLGYPAAQPLRRRLDRALDRLLARRADAFETGAELCRRYEIAVDATEDIACGQFAPGREEM